MQLLYVCSDYGVPPAGSKGASVHLRAITRALAELGHGVALLSPRGSIGGDHPATAVLPERCPLVDDVTKTLKPWLIARGMGDSVARELRPLLYGACVGEKAVIALRDRRPDAILERLSLFGHIGIDLADALNVPLIVEMNAPLVEEAARYRSLEMIALAERIERRVLERADAVVVVSSELAERLGADGVPRGKVHVVPNGVDLAAFDNSPPRDACRTALGLSGELAIGFVGSLKEWHGVDVLLSAFDRLRRRGANARLIVVGAGPCAESLKRETERAGLTDAVTFTGAIAHEAVPAMLRAIDVAVAPFRSVPGFYFSPIKLFEYMAAGTCLVASRLGQIAEVVENDVTGLLCEPDSVDALLAALDRAASSVDLRRRLATAAETVVRSRYTWAHAARRVSDIIEETRTIARRSGRARRGPSETPHAAGLRESA